MTDSPSDLQPPAPAPQLYWSKREFFVIPIDEAHSDELASHNFDVSQISNYTMGEPQVAIVANDLQVIEGIISASEVPAQYTAVV